MNLRKTEKSISRKGRKKGRAGISLFLACVLAASFFASLNVRAAETKPEPLQTPAGSSLDPDTAPLTYAEAAVLVDIDTGVMLYEKNVHTRFYPASVTKVLTCLLAAENCELDETVTFSHQAVYGIERGSSNIGMDEGETLSLKDALYAAMLESANEVASALGEHVAGSEEAFAEMMNEKVAALGGTDSHFVNANGLHNDNHYTSAYDLALVGREFFRNETLTEISGTPYYHINATDTQKDEIDLRNHHRMLPGCQLSRRRTYDYTIGGKTGYTDVSRNTLITAAEKDGHRLLCVVLKEETPNHYLDSISLFDWGFGLYENAETAALIEEKAEQLRAEQAAAEAPEEPEPAEIQGGAIDLTESQTVAVQPLQGEEKEAKKESKQSSSLWTVIGIVTIVLLAGAVVGFLRYKKEAERRRRRAAVMARSRAQRTAQNIEEDNW